MTLHTLAAETCMNTEYSHYSIFIPNALSAGRHSTLHVPDLIGKRYLVMRRRFYSLLSEVYILKGTFIRKGMTGMKNTTTSQPSTATPPQPPDGAGVSPRPHRFFFRDSAEHADDRELNLGIPDLWFKSNLVTLTEFPGQVRSLTYDVISKHWHGPQMSQLRHALSARKSFTRR